MKCRRPLASVAALALLFIATSCSNEVHDAHCARLSGGGSYCLQPGTAVAPFELQQKIEARFRGKTETLIAELEVDAAGMQLVGLTPFGQTLLKVSYNNQVVSAAAMPDARLQPALLIALIQLALWPADALRIGLEAPLRLEVTPGQRRILNGNEVVLTISYTGDFPQYERIQMNLHDAAIEVDIKTLEQRGNEKAEPGQ